VRAPIVVERVDRRVHTVLALPYDVDEARLVLHLVEEPSEEVAAVHVGEERRGEDQVGRACKDDPLAAEHVEQLGGAGRAMEEGVVAVVRHEQVAIEDAHVGRRLSAAARRALESGAEGGRGRRR
jgi:hypothetical protein